MQSYEQIVKSWVEWNWTKMSRDEDERGHSVVYLFAAAAAAATATAAAAGDPAAADVALDA